MLFAQKQGTALIDSLKQEMQTLNNDTAKAKTLSQLSLAIAGSDIDSAIIYANECMEISKKADWTKGVGLAWYALAYAKFVATDYTTSQQYSQEAYTIAKEVNDKKNMAFALRIIGWNNDWLGYYSKALENYFSALRLFEEINDKRGVASCYNSIGGVYYYTYDYDKAMEYYNKSLRGMQELNDAPSMASSYMNIASVFKDLKKYDSSAVYNMEAIKIFEAVNNQVALAKAYNNRGNLMMELHDAKSAYEYYLKAVEIFKKTGVKIKIADAYASIGVLYFTLVKESTVKYTLPPLLNTNKAYLLQQSQYYFLQALALTKEEGELTLSMDYVDLLSQTEEELGDYKAALAYHKEYMTYKDSIFNDANKKKITELETQRLTEVKNKEIELKNSELKRQTLIKNIILISVTAVTALLTAVFIWLYNRRRKIKFDTQVKEVEMKALRSQMNPHFIFNSLHSINKYVMENDKENASAYLSKFSNLMRLILENSREQEVPLEKDSRRIGIIHAA